MTKTAQLETLTPEVAEAYLTKRDANIRSINSTRVDRYARQMKAGNWRGGVADVIFMEDGSLVGGQHCVSAVAQSGVAIDVTVKRGFTQDDLIAIDRGQTRTVKQWFDYNGVKNSSAMSAAANMVLKVEKGVQFNNAHAAQQIAEDEIWDFYQANEAAFVAAHELSNPVYSYFKKTEAGWLTLAYLLYQYDPEEATSFFAGLIPSTPKPKGDARWGFYNWLNAGAQKKVAWQEVVGQGIKVFNYVHHGLASASLKGLKANGATTWNWPDIGAVPAGSKTPVGE